MIVHIAVLSFTNKHRIVIARVTFTHKVLNLAFTDEDKWYIFCLDGKERLNLKRHDGQPDVIGWIWWHIRAFIFIQPELDPRTLNTDVCSENNPERCDHLLMYLSILLCASIWPFWKFEAQAKTALPFFININVKSYGHF